MIKQSSFTNMFLVDDHRWRADLLRNNNVLMFVDVGMGGTSFCVRALVNGMIPQGKQYHMAWFTEYSAAYECFDALNTGRMSPTERWEREQQVKELLEVAGQLHGQAG